MSYTKKEAKDRFAAIDQDLKNGLISLPEADTQRAYVEQRLNGTSDANLPQWSDPQEVPLTELVEDTHPRDEEPEPEEESEPEPKRRHFLGRR